MSETISLKAARINAELSLKDAGSLMGKSSKTISLWERGIVPIKAIDFEKLCKKVYGINPAMVDVPIVNDGKYDE